jgi:2-polyprenyl-6-methoxyphenol hydroxylase-like FAD-dependent oxidoreductase
MTTSPVRSVLIAGAGIAGPALAFWLRRYGFAVTVLERAPSPRPGGQAVDLRGVSRDAVTRMGLMDRVMDARTRTLGMSVVTAGNRRVLTYRADQFGGDGMIAEIEILRGDLAEVLREACDDTVEFLFGRYVERLEQDDEGVTVTLSDGGTRRVDLVVGADGLHSPTRELVFGPDPDRVRDLGHLMAFFTVPNHLNLRQWMLGYGADGCTAAIRAIRDDAAAMALLSVPGTRADYPPGDPAGQRALLRSRLAGLGWEVPYLLDRMDDAPDFHFDSCSQVHMPSWSRGRVVLLGDAACCPSPLSGQGTGVAVVGAYLLAGELAAADGDHAGAFDRYEQRMRPWVEGSQKMGAEHAKRFAPRGRFDQVMQVVMMKLLLSRPLSGLLERRANTVLRGIELPDYRHLEEEGSVPR